MIALTAKSLYTPLERIDQPLLFVENRHITEVVSRLARELPPEMQLIDFGDAVLAPGYLDIHIHGGGGHDVMEQGPEGLLAIEKLLADHGVTSYLPTTVTAPFDQTLSALERLAGAIEAAQRTDHRGLRAVPIGIHLEGPFLSHARRGVHPAELLLVPTVETFGKFWEASRGHIRVMTIAPELEGAEEVITDAARRGVCVSIGHSDADILAARRAVAAGARNATHVFNAMRPLTHRDPGILGEVLTNSEVTTEVIADGIHLDPAIARLVLQMKAPDKAVLVTDGTAATGMPDGRYWLGPIEVEVKNGRCTSNGTLAGSVLTMDRAVRNAMDFAGLDLQQAVRLATLNPSRSLGLEDRGILRAGSRADLVVLDPDGEVRKSIIGGEAGVGS